PGRVEWHVQGRAREELPLRLCCGTLRNRLLHVLDRGGRGTRSDADRYHLPGNPARRDRDGELAQGEHPADHTTLPAAAARRERHRPDVTREIPNAKPAYPEESLTG